MRKAVISLLAGDVFDAPTGGVAVPAFKLAWHTLGMIRGRSRAALPVS
jgi:hypothetical protein